MVTQTCTETDLMRAEKAPQSMTADRDWWKERWNEKMRDIRIWRHRDAAMRGVNTKLRRTIAILRARLEA